MHLTVNTYDATMPSICRRVICHYVYRSYSTHIAGYNEGSGVLDPARDVNLRSLCVKCLCVKWRKKTTKKTTTKSTHSSCLFQSYI